MILPIDENYRIASDRHQWIIQKSRQRMRKDRLVIEWQSQSYYPTFETAIFQLGERMVREVEAEGFTNALAEVRNVCSTLSQALPTHIKVTCVSQVEVL